MIFLAPLCCDSGVVPSAAQALTPQDVALRSWPWPRAPSLLFTLSGGSVFAHDII